LRNPIILLDFRKNEILISFDIFIVNLDFYYYILSSIKTFTIFTSIVYELILDFFRLYFNN
jgi:hypothetical protein